MPSPALSPHPHHKASLLCHQATPDCQGGVRLGSVAAAVEGIAGWGEVGAHMLCQRR
jgi:hypothetical protein